MTPKGLVSYYGQQAVREHKKSLKFTKLSYSQEGEDLIISRFLKSKNTGFYVDIGAHHPKRFSNTYLFYKKGWHGINIDAMPGSMVAFNKERPRDINLELAISKYSEDLIYYMFNESALNTFSEDEAHKKEQSANYKIIEKKLIKTLPLANILDKYCPKPIEIDFMSIDVEGLDLQVLESNNWNLYKPKLILVEELERFPIQEIVHTSSIYKFLLDLGYELTAKTMNTLFFKQTNI